jgi:AraC-like DNA-binding protein
METSEITLSIRCKMIVKAALENLELHCNKLKFNEVEVLEDLSFGQREQLKQALLKSGLELSFDNQKKVLVDKMKNIIIELIHFEDELPKMKYSVILSERLNRSYTYLSNIFSEQEGITIHQFILMQRIEVVKELLAGNALNLSEIAAKLHYSSAGHLSNQFKKMTGYSPSSFKIERDVNPECVVKK